MKHKDKTGKNIKVEKKGSFYRELINHMSSGVAVYEAVESGNNFVFKDVNRAGEKMDSINREDLIGRKITEVFPGVRDFGLLVVFKRVWKTGKPEIHPVSFYQDNRVSGWRENYVYKLPFGEIVAIYDDVTARVKFEEGLRRSEAKYRSIFETAANLITSVDNSGIIIDCNNRIKDVLGYDKDEIVGQKMSKIIHPDYIDKAQKSLECIIDKGFLNDTEYKMVSKEGVVIDVRINSSVLVDEKGEFDRTICIIEDITERKRAKAEAIRASHLAALGELAAGVAHEVNNPVNGIINYAQILLNRNELSDKDRDIAGRIIKEGNRVSIIVKNLLSFARDRRSGKQLSHIKEAVNSVLSLTGRQLENDGISLRVDVPDDLPMTIAQFQQIEQVFMNIISNARYALKHKSADLSSDKVLSISAKSLTLGGELYIRIIFYDNGIGIPIDIRDKIMNPFFTTKPDVTSTGLGLSISHGIIHDHGGRIITDSVEGEYTKIIIDLPVENVNQQEQDNLSS